MINSAAEKLAELFDDGDINFLDELEDKNTGECVAIGYGNVNSVPAWGFAQNVSEASGAFGEAHGKKIKKVYENAIKTGTPVIGIYDSFGGEIFDGKRTMAAYGELLCEANRLSGIAPSISIISGVCAAAASMIALTGDFVIMNRNAEVFLNGEDSIGGEEAVKSGLAQIVSENDEEAISKAREIMGRFPSNNLSGLPFFDDAGNSYEGNDLFESTFDDGSIIETGEGFGANAKCGFALINGDSCAFIKTEGPLDGDCCEKILRIASFCDAYNIPLVTFVDSEGFCGSGADAIKKAAKLASVYSASTNTKITVITGKAYGSVYIAFAGNRSNADEIFAVEDAVISAVTPKIAVNMLYEDKIGKDMSREDVENDYIKNEASAKQAAAGGYIDSIVTPEKIRKKISDALFIFSGKRVESLPKKHTNIIL